MTKPCLPQHSQAPAQRAAQLKETRAKYTFDQSFHGYSLVAEVPKSDHFDLGYFANAGEHAAEIAANHATAALSGWLGDKTEALREKVKSLFRHGSPKDIADARTSTESKIAEGTAAGGKMQHPLTIEQYESLYPLLPRPASVKHWREDWFFAWQRIAGCNPILIEGCSQLPNHFPLSQAAFAAAGATGSLEAAVAEGRLFLVDYSMMADVQTGQTHGRQKYLAAPIAAFVSGDDGLMPVGIQCGQKPTEETPIYTPADGVAWQMAKTSVQVADGNFQGIVSHLGYCHLVMESVIISAQRQLSSEHPLKVLLKPHFEFTLAANDVAKRTLIGPGGNTDRLQSGTIEGSTHLVQKCLANYPFSRTDAPTAFADRNVDDLGALPEYPFRDDALSSWAPIAEFASAYVHLYYSSAEDVSSDSELNAWVADMADPTAGNLHQVLRGERLQTVSDVVDLVARVIYTATTYHSAINYASWDFLAYPPNMPAAAWGPGPAPSLPATEKALANMMAPLDVTFSTLKLMYTIMMTRNHLGHYPDGTFVDPRVAPLLEAFRAGLSEASAVIDERNRHRVLPYTYLHPSMIPASIHV